MLASPQADPMSRVSIFLALLFSAARLFAFDSGSPAISVSGGIIVNGNPQPLLFTWNTPLPVNGSGWAAGETSAIVLHGPLNSPGVPAADLMLGPATADTSGNISASPVIPYDSG